MERARNYVTLLFLALLPAPVLAHVKWFSDFDFSDKPLSIQDAITPSVIGLMSLSAVALATLVIIDRQLDRFAWYTRFNAWFDERR
ncbi:MAG: hypothetical protein AAF125_05455, partial [Chloroflexota bacterium]